jgi:5-methylcytosine-specific restriction endonuclease McrA
MRSPAKKLERAVKQRAWVRQDRLDNPAKYICLDSMYSDQKMDRFGNDLTLEFVQDAIKDGCTYCGETTLRMTLDRIDNDLAHKQNNVVPSCIRCNYARGNMPYEAWLFLAPGMEAARKANAFGDWIGRLMPKLDLVPDP